MICDDSIIISALKLACEAQNVYRIKTGQRVLKALLGNKSSQYDIRNINNLLNLAKNNLNLEDEWEYRRLLELLEHLELPELLAILITSGNKSENLDIRETAKEWADYAGSGD